MRDDPAIAAIHETRHRISAAYKHDPMLLIASYQQLQKSYSDRLLPLSEPPKEHVGHVTYPAPAMADRVLAENRLEDFDAAQESGETA